MRTDERKEERVRRTQGGQEDRDSAVNLISCFVNMQEISCKSLGHVSNDLNPAKSLKYRPLSLFIFIYSLGLHASHCQA